MLLWYTMWYVSNHPRGFAVTQSRGAGQQGSSRHLDEAVRRVLRVADEPLREAFLARVLYALARLTPELSERTLGEAVGAPSDQATLLHALEDPATVPTLLQDDPLVEARLRGIRNRADLIEAEGGAFSASQVAALLGITRQAVDKRRRTGRLLALQLGARGYRYPSWQFDDTGALFGLGEVLQAMAVQSPWMRASWFLTPNPSLDGMRPIDALRAGEGAAVRRAASMFGEQGAA
jgi:hypothetical protein